MSNKANPNDIDFVTLIDWKIFEAKESEIINGFRLKGAKENYNVDAYSVKIYPDNHSKYVLTKSDLAYWYNWFTRTKKNRKRQTFAKGFLEIVFNFEN